MSEEVKCFSGQSAMCVALPSRAREGSLGDWILTFAEGSPGNGYRWQEGINMSLSDADGLMLAGLLDGSWGHWLMDSKTGTCKGIVREYRGRRKVLQGKPNGSFVFLRAKEGLGMEFDRSIDVRIPPKFRLLISTFIYRTAASMPAFKGMTPGQVRNMSRDMLVKIEKSIETKRNLENG